MKIDFIKSDGINTFSDALYLPDDHNFTDEEIEAMKQQRFDNWLLIINTPQQFDETNSNNDVSNVSSDEISN